MNSTMITLEALEQFGIETNRSDIDNFLTHLNDMLDERVGIEITESLDDTKLAELLKLQESGDDNTIGDWLQANVPELEQIAQDEIDILLGEVAENSDDFNQAG